MMRSAWRGSAGILGVFLAVGCPSGSGGGDGTAASDSTTGAQTDDTDDTEGTGPSGGGTTGTTNVADETAGPVDGSDDDSGEGPPEPGRDQTVAAFDGEPIYWAGEADDHRRARVEVEFPPEDEGYASITLDVELRCPAGGCDFWDRYGSLAVVDEPGTDDERIIEIARFVTPYRVGAALSFDVSRLRPLLTGPRTLEVVIDTWVGPGSAEGEGWLVDASFELRGGTASPRPLAVVPVYTRRAFEMGNPEQPFEDAMPARSIGVPTGTTSAELVSLVTGHGVGNADGCGEFCLENHGYLVGGVLPVQTTVWRDDCEDTPVADQIGAWSLDRAGWCPGSEVRPWIEDVSDVALAGEVLSFEYAMSPYENTCRPGLTECEGCGLFGSCEYGSAHTMPRARLSTLLVAYGE